MTFSFLKQASISAVKIAAILAAFASAVLVLGAIYIGTEEGLHLAVADAVRIVMLVFSSTVVMVFLLVIGAELTVSKKVNHNTPDSDADQ
ncbi:MAG: hypothetical protein P8P99_07275 [Maricaulis sp.]|nr:hypothetical protein [Maricaulis sp.]